jgi:hypothetical protein
MFYDYHCTPHALPSTRHATVGVEGAAPKQLVVLRAEPHLHAARVTRTLGPDRR